MIYDPSPSTWDIVITHSDARFFGGITSGGIKGIATYHPYKPCAWTRVQKQVHLPRGSATTFVCVCVSHFMCVPSISLLILCYFVMVYPCLSDKVKPTQWVGYSANKPTSNGPKSRSQLTGPWVLDAQPACSHLPISSRKIIHLIWYLIGDSWLSLCGSWKVRRQKKWLQHLAWHGVLLGHRMFGYWAWTIAGGFPALWASHSSRRRGAAPKTLRRSWPSPSSNCSA